MDSSLMLSQIALVFSIMSVLSIIGVEWLMGKMKRNERKIIIATELRVRAFRKNTEVN